MPLTAFSLLLVAALTPGLAQPGMASSLATAAAAASNGAASSAAGAPPLLVTTLVLADWPEELDMAKPLRFRVTHAAGSRAGLVAGLSAAAGVPPGALRFLVASAGTTTPSSPAPLSKAASSAGGAWVDVGAFEALQGAVPLSRVVRCIASGTAGRGGGGSSSSSSSSGSHDSGSGSNDSGSGGAASPRAPALMLPWRRFGDVTFGESGARDLVVGGHRVRLPGGPDDIAPEDYFDAGSAASSASSTSRSDEGEGEGGRAVGPHGATGRTLWDGAVLLAMFLDAHPEVAGACTHGTPSYRGWVGARAHLRGRRHQGSAQAQRARFF